VWTGSIHSYMCVAIFIDLLLFSWSMNRQPPQPGLTLEYHSLNCGVLKSVDTFTIWWIAVVILSLTILRGPAWRTFSFFIIHESAATLTLAKLGSLSFWLAKFRLVSRRFAQIGLVLVASLDVNANSSRKRFPRLRSSKACWHGITVTIRSTAVVILSILRGTAR
jgi:hypothetical protein